MILKVVALSILISCTLAAEPTGNQAVAGDTVPFVKADPNAQLEINPQTKELPVANVAIEWRPQQTSQPPVQVVDTAAEEDDGEYEEVNPEIIEFKSDEFDVMNDYDDWGFGDRRRHHGGRGRHPGPHHRRPHPHPRPGPHPTGRPHTGPTRHPRPPHPRPTGRPHLGLKDDFFVGDQSLSNSESSEQSSSSSEEEKPKVFERLAEKEKLHVAGKNGKDIDRERLEEYAMLKMHEFRRTCGIVAVILGWVMLVAVLAVCARLCCCFLRRRRTGTGFFVCPRRCTNGAPYSVMVDAAQSDRMPIIVSESGAGVPQKDSI